MYGIETPPGNTLRPRRLEKRALGRKYVELLLCNDWVRVQQMGQNLEANTLQLANIAVGICHTAWNYHLFTNIMYPCEMFLASFFLHRRPNTGRLPADLAASNSSSPSWVFTMHRLHYGGVKMALRWMQPHCSTNLLRGVLPIRALDGTTLLFC